MLMAKKNAKTDLPPQGSARTSFRSQICLRFRFTASLDRVFFEVKLCEIAQSFKASIPTRTLKVNRGLI